MLSYSIYNTYPSLALNNISFPWTTHFKYMGVTFGQNLNFNHHVNYIIKKVVVLQCILYPILNQCSSTPSRIRINSLKMYVLPIMTCRGGLDLPYHQNPMEKYRSRSNPQTIGVITIVGLLIHVKNVVTLSTARPLNYQKLHTQTILRSVLRKFSFFHIKNLGLDTTIFAKKWHTKTSPFKVNLIPSINPTSY